ncbi:MAG: hypothetical protein JWR10_4510 [Rubritepida sp.]|nr:hypothetical protein [Rubritepida sp.]
MRRRFILAIGAATAMSGPAGAQSAVAAAARLNGQHPSAYYTEAMRLFRAGQREDAVFVFYLGQLRYRTHLAAHPELPRSGDPAAFGALSETVGRPINEYAFGDMPRLMKTIDAVLAYDRGNPDRFTDPAAFPEAYRRNREGMVGFRNDIAGRMDEIRRTRQSNGLENR